MEKWDDQEMRSYVHHVPGRLRVRLPFLRNNLPAMEEVKALLEIEGTTRCKANPLTGSVVVNYDPQALAAGQLLEILQNNGYIHVGRVVTLDAKLRNTSNQAARKVGRALFGWAVGRVLDANGLSLIAAFI